MAHVLMLPASPLCRGSRTQKYAHSSHRRTLVAPHVTDGRWSSMRNADLRPDQHRRTHQQATEAERASGNRRRGLATLGRISLAAAVCPRRCPGEGGDLRHARSDSAHMSAPFGAMVAASAASAQLPTRCVSVCCEAVTMQTSASDH